MGLIGWLIIGALAGVIAGNIMKGGGFGLIGDIVVGIIGAVIGGFLVGLFNPDFSMSGQSWWVSLPVAILGAIILIWLARLVMPGRRI